ncbi:MAG: hypothetical protein LBR79_02345 [Oscillospiraceae bacterium]|nr:hypothetical protein [Oscillospiraceae bacterium]
MTFLFFPPAVGGGGKILSINLDYCWFTDRSSINYRSKLITSNPADLKRRL